MRRTIALVGALAVLAGACGGDDGTTTQGGTATPPAEFTVVGDEYGYEAPAEVSGGVVTMTFRNEGELVHEAVLLGIGDTSVEQAVEDFSGVVQGGPIPAYMSVAGGVGDVESDASESSTFTLPEGNYVFICALTDADSAEGDPGEVEGLLPHSENGMVRAVKVTGDNERSLPAADGTITARDYGFDVPTLGAGEHTLVFENEGREFHHVVMMEFPEGVDEAGAAGMFAAMAEMGPDSAPPSGPMPEEIGFSAVFGPGLGGTFPVTLQSGRTYAALCFISDRTGGPPHAFAHQMVEYFTVA